MMSMFKKAIRRKLRDQVDIINVKDIKDGENIKNLIKSDVEKAREALYNTIEKMAENK